MSSRVVTDAKREAERLNARKYYLANKDIINQRTKARSQSGGKREKVLELNRKLRDEAEEAVVELLAALEVQPLERKGRFDTRCIHACRAALTKLQPPVAVAPKP